MTLMYSSTRQTLLCDVMNYLIHAGIAKPLFLSVGVLGRNLGVGGRQKMELKGK